MEKIKALKALIRDNKIGFMGFLIILYTIMSLIVHFSN